MRRDEKTAAEGTSFSDGQQLALDMGKPLAIYFTPEPGTIASLLHSGRENAMTSREICRVTGLKFRKVTLMILAERRAGAPILSSPDCGYWIARDAAEVISCAAGLHNRAKAIHATAAALECIVR